MKREWHTFLTAVMFYTRIRVPAHIDHAPGILNAATKYLPLIGIIVGLAASLAYHVGIFLFNPGIAVILSMITSILVTGAFHEDGLADTCDGFGGGWTKEKILLIMKDSRSGAFGVTGIALALLLKFVTLSSIPVALFMITTIAAHALSRWCCTLIIAYGSYAREDASSKAKPVAQHMKPAAIVLSCIIGLSTLLFFPCWQAVLALPVILIATFLLYRYFKKWIGGYTGDCLGATQQITELLLYLSLVAVWKFIL